MLGIKKLDMFILRSFLLLFSGTFFICLFIFMMQFLWRYVDELIGKGLSIDVLAQFFFLSGLTLIPISLPLSILLTSLITFGNFGERYELLSMKAAGISLIRIIRPLVFLAVFLAGTSFYFQNIIAPKAQKELWTLLVSMKIKSPEVEIPENVFYSDIPGYNIYVKKKDKETGVLSDVLIYDYKDGFSNARIIWAEKGMLQMTADKKHLFLHLYNGEQFENLQSQTFMTQSVPYRRESFKEKHALIDFNTDFEKVDGSFLNSRSDIKNMNEIALTIDSLHFYADSVGRSLYKEAMEYTYHPPILSKEDSMALAKQKPNPINTDSIYNTLSASERLKLINRADISIARANDNWNMKSFMITDTDNNIRSHQSDWHRKITLSLACVIFFFIGAPLGAIIRKGGLGMPVVISVLIFILYYVIDSGTIRVAKSGEINVILGTWMSTLVLAPLGIFLTYKSNNDSVVFNIDYYKAFFRKTFAIPTKRHIFRKDVVIDVPDIHACSMQLATIRTQSVTYLDTHKLFGPPNYFKLYLSNTHDEAIADISRSLETIIESLSNVRDSALINYLNQFPYLSTRGHKSLSDNRWLNLLVGLVVPLGLVIWLRVWFFRVRLRKDLKTILTTIDEIQERISTTNTPI